LLAAGVLALGGCGDDDDDTASPTETATVEESAAPTNEAEATEQLDLKFIHDEAAAADFGLPNSDCVAEALFFGADTASDQQGSKGVVIAPSGEWGITLTKDSDTPECIEAWQDAMG
jgi:hypothetical protein